MTSEGDDKTDRFQSSEEGHAGSVPERWSGNQMPRNADAKPEAITAQWEAARTAVFAQLLAGIGSFHDAEDVLQEVAICVSKQYHKYDPARPFVAWALGIARNQMLMFLRKQRRDRLTFGESMMAIVVNQLAEESPKAVRDGRREALAACIEELPPQRRELIKMRYGGVLSLAEIAAKQGKSSSSIKAALFRLRNALLTCVKRRMALT